MTNKWNRVVPPTPPRPAVYRRAKSPDISERSNQKLKTRFRMNFALVALQLGDLGFWCTLGAYLGVVCRQGSQWLCIDIGSLDCVSQWHKGCHCVSQVISVSRPTLCYKLASVKRPIIGSDFHLALWRMIAMPGQGSWNDIMDPGRSLDVLLTRCNLPISNHLSNCAMI